MFCVSDRQKWEDSPREEFQASSQGKLENIRWRPGPGLLFSRILLDLFGRKTSGQKATDSIKCGQMQGSDFCDEHIKTASLVLNSLWSAIVLAKDLEILHLDSSLRLLAKRQGRL